MKIAELLEYDPAYVMACMAAERSKDAKVKKTWEWTAHHLGGLAAALALVAILPTINLSDDDFNIAFAGIAAPEAWAGTVYYVKSLADISCAYWFALLPLAALAFRYFPRHTPRPKNN